MAPVTFVLGCLSALKFVIKSSISGCLDRNNLRESLGDVKLGIPEVSTLKGRGLFSFCFPC